jgi:hypothetical protein
MFQSNLVQSLTFYPFSSLVPCTIKCEDGVRLDDVFNEYCEYTFGGIMKGTYLHPDEFKKAIQNILQEESWNKTAPEIENLFGTIRTLQDRNIFIALDK